MHDSESIKQAKAAVEYIKKGGTIKNVDSSGSLYKVDLPDGHIARMLDWDKPLSQQTPEVKKYISGFQRQPAADQPVGDWFENKMREGISPYLSDDLKKLGVPGIRYLDSGSRTGGAGTSNYVVFPGNEGLLKILERNGQPVKTAQSGLLSTENVGMKAKDYGAAHRPMQDAGGASRLHDLTTSYGEDVYGPNALQYFGSGDPREKATLRILQSLRGKPEAKVTIYRGVPPDTAGAINHGDWVTLDPKVAKDYGEKVLKMQVPASHVTAWPDSMLEYGYFPPSK
jgi:hypothetical protein